MKKFLSTVAIAGVATLALASCGKKSATTTPAAETTTPAGTTTVATTTEEAATETWLDEAARSTVNSTYAGNYDITLWMSETEGVATLTQTQIDRFMTLFPDIKITATVEGVSESNSATQMIADVTTGADIYGFAQDQLTRLVQAGALSQLGDAMVARVKANNASAAVSAGQVAGAQYALPLTADNGYFMYYNKADMEGVDMTSMEAIIAKCEELGTKFTYELKNNTWYNAGFFFATGCHTTWTTDTEGNWTSFDDNFNSPEGLIALKGMQKILKSECHDDASSAAAFGNPVRSSVVISGTWDSSTAKAKLGDNYACAELPCFTVDGTSYHLGSFAGNKMIGVKPQEDANKAVVCQLLAEYLTLADQSMERFDLVGWGPASKVAQANPAVIADEALTALNKQNAYATVQGQLPGSWWDYGKAYATSAETATTDAELQAALDAYQASIEGVINQSDEDKKKLSVIGINGDWSTDAPMSLQDDGTYRSDAAFTVEAESSFKIRMGASWDNSWGAAAEKADQTLLGSTDDGNAKFLVSGTYYVFCEVDADGMVTTLWVEAAEE